MTGFSAGFQEGEEVGPLLSRPRELLYDIQVKHFYFLYHFQQIEKEKNRKENNKEFSTNVSLFPPLQMPSAPNMASPS